MKERIIFLLLVVSLLLISLTACNSVPPVPVPPVPQETYEPESTSENEQESIGIVWTSTSIHGMTVDIPTDWRKAEFDFDKRLEIRPSDRDDEGFILILIMEDVTFNMLNEPKLYFQEIVEYGESADNYLSTDFLDYNIDVKENFATRWDFTNVISSNEIPRQSYLIMTDYFLYWVMLGIRDDSPLNITDIFDSVVKSIKFDPVDRPLPERLGTDVVIEELTELYNNADGVEELLIETDYNDNISINITYNEPYERNDFPSLVIPFVDNVISVANNNNVLVTKLNISLNQDDKSFVYYVAENDSTQNDGLKSGRMTFPAFRFENDRSNIEYNNLFSYDEGIEALVTKWTGLISITGFSTSRPNSAGGVNMTIKWKNESENEIKYITFDVQPFNAVDDSVSCEIRRNSSIDLEFTGPFKAGSRNTSTERNAWYNSDIRSARLNEIVIEYMDGAKVEVRSNFLGFDKWWNSMIG